MNERIISITGYDPVAVYGVSDRNLDALKALFPKLKIIARGDIIKALGPTEVLDTFEERFELILSHLDRFGSLTPSVVSQLVMEEETPIVKAERELENGVLVHGTSGRQVRAITPNQQRLVESCNKNDLVFAIGPAGTGKTYTAVALAVRALKQKKVKRIILTRPAVEAGESLGYLPGDLREKLDPYLQPLYDALRDMIPTQKLLKWLEDGTIEVAPLAFMRGRTLDHAFAILDEAQNATELQLKMFVTRMGRSAKFIVTGDMSQVDLPNRQPSGLIQARKILTGIKGIDFVYLDGRDVVRHALVTRIIKAYDKENDQK